jgi:hypothetical protein
MRLILLFVVSSLLLMLPAVAAAELGAAQKSAICQTRSTCTIGKSYDGGKSPAGAPLTVVEVHLGVKDKPDDAPDNGCQAGDKFDGGVEYWLLEGAASPKRILKLCNDGYGSAGIGADDVRVGANQLVHKQIGGSAWRWDSTVTYTLSPWRASTERDCSYNDASANNGILTDINFLTMTVRSISKDASSNWEDNAGCPRWPPEASAHFTPQPAPNLLAAYNILVPVLGKDVPPAPIPAGAAIGDCVPAMTTGGANGFIVFGNPAPAAQAAEIRAVAESLHSLLIQVYDPAAAAQPPSPKGSWINLPHIEIWTGLNTESVRTRLPVSQLAQVAVDLNGKVYTGVGRKEPPPAVQRWQTRDAAGHPVVVMRLTWADDSHFLYGAALVYSQAEAGRQARLVATTGIVRNHPLYMPDITSLPNGNLDPLPGNCRIRNGRLAMGS